MVCGTCCDWCMENYIQLKYVWSSISVGSYSADVGTDINAGVNYIANGDYWWAGCTFFFVFLAMYITGVMHILGGFGRGKSRWTKILLGLLTFVSAPFFPFAALVADAGIKIYARFKTKHRQEIQTRYIPRINMYGYSDNVNDNYNPDYSIELGIRNENRHSEDRNDKLAKFYDFLARTSRVFESLGEAYPQTKLQSYIVSQALALEEEVKWWQWLTIAVSFLSLSFTISTSHFFGDIKVSTRVAFFFFGLLATVARTSVSCVYSMHHKYLFVIPFVSELVVSIVFWSIKNWCPSSMCVPLDDSNRRIGIWAACEQIFVWILTAAYNSFTMSGLLVSTTNLAFAVGGCFLDVPSLFAITSLTLAIISWMCNIIILAVPKFESIRTDWLQMDEDGESAQF